MFIGSHTMRIARADPTDLSRDLASLVPVHPDRTPSRNAGHVRELRSPSRVALRLLRARARQRFMKPPTHSESCLFAQPCRWPSAAGLFRLARFEADHLAADV
jgi:hypothetical protein